MKNLAQIYETLGVRAPIEYLQLLEKFTLVRFDGHMANYNKVFIQSITPFCKKGLLWANAYPELEGMPKKNWFQSLLFRSDLYFIEPVLTEPMLNLWDIQALRKFTFESRLGKKDASVKYLQETLKKLVFFSRQSYQGSYRFFSSWAEEKGQAQIKTQIDSVFQNNWIDQEQKNALLSWMFWYSQYKTANRLENNVRYEIHKVLADFNFKKYNAAKGLMLVNSYSELIALNLSFAFQKIESNEDMTQTRDYFKSLISCYIKEKNWLLKQNYKLEFLLEKIENKIQQLSNNFHSRSIQISIFLMGLIVFSPVIIVGSFLSALLEKYQNVWLYGEVGFYKRSKYPKKRKLFNAPFLKSLEDFPMLTQNQIIEIAQQLVNSPLGQYVVATGKLPHYRLRVDKEEKYLSDNIALRLVAPEPQVFLNPSLGAIKKKIHKI